MKFLTPANMRGKLQRKEGNKVYVKIIKCMSYAAVSDI
jgi:hypothetical protein